MPVDMEIERLQLFITRIHKLVRHVCGDNNDLSCMRFRRGGFDGEGRYTCLCDKNLYMKINSSSSKYEFVASEIHGGPPDEKPPPARAI